MKPKQPKPGARITDPAAFRRALFSKRGTMRDTLPHVRRLTPQSSLADCIKPCLAIPAYRTAFVQSPFPKAYASIKPGRPLLPVSPAFDFEWTSVVLEHFVEELTSFVTLRDRFYDTMLLDLHAEAAEILDAIESEFGVSLWIIGARIALLQARYGVTAQKEFLESFLNQSGLNILARTIHEASALGSSGHDLSVAG